MQKQSSFINAYSFLITGAMALSLFSCQSDRELENEFTNSDLSTSSVSKAAASFSARSLNLPVEKIYLFPADKNYEMIDMGRYALGNVLKDLLTEDMLNKIMQYAKSNGKKSVSFEKIFSLIPELKDKINQGLAVQHLPACPYDFSSFANIKNVMSRNGIDYDLELYILNLESNASAKSFILTPGAELADEANNEDQVMAWYKDIAMPMPVPVKITENEAKTYAAIGTFATIGLNPKTPVVTGGGTTPIGGPLSARKINMRQINIHERFEKYGKSEVYMHAINKSGTNWNPVFAKNFPANDRTKHLVSTGNTFQWVTVDKGQYLFPSNFSVVWNTFERDWWEGYKLTNNVSAGLSIQENGAPMTFANEWYSLYPVNNTLSNNKSMGPLTSVIISNGGNNTYVQGDWNRSEANFYAQ